MTRRIAVVSAPSHLGLRPPAPGALPGAHRAPDALRAHGIVGRLAARDAGGLQVPPYSPDPDVATGYRNGGALRAFTEALADRTTEVLRGGELPLVLGGDCSILLGNVLALRRLGRYGLVFVDGHDDFSPPRDAAACRGILNAAGLDLALATGRGPAALADVGGLRPYVADEDVALVGVYQSPSDARDYDVETILGTRITRLPIERIRAEGVRRVAEEALRVVARPELAGFWIHVDVDVLDRTVMPAVDSPNESGLGLDELSELLSVLVASPRAVGMELTIYDPDLDPGGALGARLVDAVVQGLAPLAGATGAAAP